MLVLGTNHLTILDQKTVEALSLVRRLEVVPLEEVAVTIITYEEQMRGWMAYIARADTSARPLEAYERLLRHVERFRRTTILPSDAAAAAQLERSRQARVRIGAMDLKIAAICLARDATLLTRNLTRLRQGPRPQGGGLVGLRKSAAG